MRQARSGSSGRRAPADTCRARLPGRSAAPPVAEASSRSVLPAPGARLAGRRCPPARGAGAAVAAPPPPASPPGHAPWPRRPRRRAARAHRPDEQGSPRPRRTARRVRPRVRCGRASEAGACGLPARRARPERTTRRAAQARARPRRSRCSPFPPTSRRRQLRRGARGAGGRAALAVASRLPYLSHRTAPEPTRPPNEGCSRDAPPGTQAEHLRSGDTHRRSFWR